MNEKNVFQRFTPAIPQWLKSSLPLGYCLKYGSAVVSQLGLKHLLYNDEKNIISKILIALKRTVNKDEIQFYQDECRSLFRPEQRLIYSSRELILYPLIRILKPETIVETGCAWGGSASFLLAALHRNENGRLISIDLPASETIQQKEMGITVNQIGALIPTDLRERWHLVVGDARIHLPRVLSEVKADIFIHDSLHTTTHQMFEYEVARSLMRNTSLIASDDIRWNDSFPSFLKLHRLRGYAPLGNKNFAVTVNVFNANELKYGLFYE